jgi:putative membrane protein
MVVALQLSPWDVVTRIGFHPAPLIVLAAAVAGYRLGVRRLARQGHQWPSARSASFGVAILLLAVATLSGLTSYDHTSFSVSAVQQLAIFMLVPLFLCLSAPLELIIQCSPGSWGPRLRGWIMGTPGRVLYQPVLAWAIFAASTFALYLSREYAWALGHTGGLDLINLELLVVGCWWIWPVVGADPRPRPLAIGWRMLYILLAVVYYSVLGLAMESQRTPIAKGLTVSDLHTGAGVLWSTGALLSIAMSIGVLVQWLQVDEGYAQRTDRRNAEEDAQQLAMWRSERRAAALADVRARESLNVRSRPSGSERSDRTARSARSWSPAEQPPSELEPSEVNGDGPAGPTR